ncbi:acylphosphatase [Streptacidiphilus sp. 4-A2]|nr:acylphosphatase [Streptacidiphilus sp. 4-A2]
MSEDVRMTAWVRGAVQQVGFRWWTRSRALEIGLLGYASNLGDGRVQVVAQGSREQCERLLDLLKHGDTPGRVDGVTEIWVSRRTATRASPSADADRPGRRAVRGATTRVHRTCVSRLRFRPGHG